MRALSRDHAAERPGPILKLDEQGNKNRYAVAAILPPTLNKQVVVVVGDFENGIVLVNPKGNGAVEVTLEEDFKRLSGNQAPTVNNGAVTRKLVLQDRDGIILKRIKPVAAPSAPKLPRSSR